MNIPTASKELKAAVLKEEMAAFTKEIYRCEIGSVVARRCGDDARAELLCAAMEKFVAQYNELKKELENLETGSVDAGKDDKE